MKSQLVSMTRQFCSKAVTTTGRGANSADQFKALTVVRELLVDTLGLMKDMESAGLTRAQAEKITKTITELLCDNKEKLSDKFVPKSAIEKIILEQEAKIAGFKTELQKAQDVHSSAVNKDIERQQGYLDKMRAEVRHEIDKLTASQRLDLNLEKGRMRDDLQTLRDKTAEMEIRLDREVNTLKATVEKAKNDIIISVVALLGTFSAIAFTVSRLMGAISQ